MSHPLVPFLLLFLAACGATTGIVRPERSIVSIENGADRLRAGFNAASDKTRLLAVLAPTCGSCLQGAAAVQEELLRSHPEEDLAVHFVWGNILPSDSRASAVRLAHGSRDPRVHHYWDPDMTVGQELSRHVHVPAMPFVWDIYLLYQPGIKWTDDMPPPASWVHRMEGVDDTHFRERRELSAALDRALADLHAEAP